MKSSTRIVIAVFLVLFGFAGSVRASEEDVLKETVSRNMDQLVATFESRKGLYNTDPDKFYVLMEEALEPFVDFERIAMRVMGRYRREATPDQIRRFTEVFKRSLFEAYGKALVDSGKFSLKVRRVVIDPRRSTRASVMVDIQSASGNVYPVIYSMHQDAQGIWKMENVIVNGVNVGLAFKERFEQAYQQAGGNLDKVIAEWKADVEIKTDKAA